MIRIWYILVRFFVKNHTGNATNRIDSHMQFYVNHQTCKSHFEKKLHCRNIISILKLPKVILVITLIYEGIDTKKGIQI